MLLWRKACTYTIYFCLNIDIAQYRLQWHDSNILVSFQFLFLSEVLQWRAQTTPDHLLYTLLNCRVGSRAPELIFPNCFFQQSELFPGRSPPLYYSQRLLFPVSMVKYSNKTNIWGKGFISAQRLQFTTVKKVTASGAQDSKSHCISSQEAESKAIKAHFSVLLLPPQYFPPKTEALMISAVEN